MATWSCRHRAKRVLGDRRIWAWSHYAVFVQNFWYGQHRHSSELTMTFFSLFKFSKKNKCQLNEFTQRLHYSWKKYLAQNKFSDFTWVQRWDSGKQFAINVHNNPFDMYDSRTSCGPDTEVTFICIQVKISPFACIYFV